jgi:hypothetical protein
MSDEAEAPKPVMVMNIQDVKRWEEAAVAAIRSGKDAKLACAIADLYIDEIMERRKIGRTQ